MVDALRSTYTVTELLCELNLPRSSYFYHRARPEVADKYVDMRQAMTDTRQRCMRGFFGRLKIEMFFSRDWLHTTIDEFIAYLDAYIRWYNEARIKVSFGARRPIEHRRNLGIAV